MVLSNVEEKPSIRFRSYQSLRTGERSKNGRWAVCLRNIYKAQFLMCFLQGLVLLTAIYETRGDEEGEEVDSIDVTLALQTQVRDSQLTIPGGRSKVCIYFGREELD